MLNVDSKHVDLTSRLTDNESIIQNVKDVFRLNISKNHLKHIIFENSDSLEILDASFNDFESMDCIKQLQFLRILNIKSNKLKYIEHAIYLKNLKAINISDNKLENIDMLSECLKLKTIVAANNQLSKIPNLSKCEHLVTLNVANNNISSLYEAGDRLPKSIKQLFIEKNRIKSLVSTLQLRPLINLRYISITDNDFVIELKNNHINYILPILWLMGNNKLRQIDDREIGDIEFKAIVKLDNLGYEFLLNKELYTRNDRELEMLLKPSAFIKKCQKIFSTGENNENHYSEQEAAFCDRLRNWYSKITKIRISSTLCEDYDDIKNKQAVKIQKLWRGALSRNKARKIMYLFRCVIKIQSLYRGYIVRKRFYPYKEKIYNYLRHLIIEEDKKNISKSETAQINSKTNHNINDNSELLEQVKQNEEDDEFSNIENRHLNEIQLENSYKTKNDYQDHFRTEEQQSSINNIQHEINKKHDPIDIVKNNANSDSDLLLAELNRNNLELNRINNFDDVQMELLERDKQQTRSLHENENKVDEYLNNSNNNMAQNESMNEESKRKRSYLDKNKNYSESFIDNQQKNKIKKFYTHNSNTKFNDDKNLYFQLKKAKEVYNEDIDKDSAENKDSLMTKNPVIKKAKQVEIKDSEDSNNEI